MLCRCDNAAVVALINAGYCKHERGMHLLRCLFFIATHFDFDIFACHIPGSLNVAADALSCNLLPLFLAKVPEAETLPTTIPPRLLKVLIHTRLWEKQIYTLLPGGQPDPFPCCRIHALHLCGIFSFPRFKTPNNKILPISSSPLTEEKNYFDPFNQQSLVKLELVLKGIKRYQAALGIKS